jgi:hypothetical protein
VSRPDLERILDDIAAALAGEGTAAERDSAGGTVTWSRAGVPFAVLGDVGVELHLDATIAAAAARTPDAAPSDRGREWVRFNPHALDPHAVDRLEAWFRLAVRRATGGSGSDDRRP